MSCTRSGITVCLGILLLCASQLLTAGPLDRTDMGPRVNPATNDMLRVPGVVGMDSQNAMATLQQAGLNPRIHFIHRVTKSYAGQEGAVVKQIPLPGGMAMLGSSVTLTVYAPGNTPATQRPPPDESMPGSGMGEGDIQFLDPAGDQSSSSQMGDMPGQSPGMDNTEPSSSMSGDGDAPGSEMGSGEMSSPETSGSYNQTPNSQSDTGNASSSSPDESVPTGTDWGADENASPTLPWRPSGQAPAPDVPRQGSRPEGQQYLKAQHQSGTNP